MATTYPRPYGLGWQNRPFGPDVWAMDSMCGRWIRCVGDGDVWAMDSRSRVDNDRKSAHERSIQIVRDAMVSTSWVGGGEPDPGLIGAFAAQRAASVSPGRKAWEHRHHT